jgi:hypothetical protein
MLGGKKGAGKGKVEEALRAASVLTLGSSIEVERERYLCLSVFLKGWHFCVGLFTKKRAV